MTKRPKPIENHVDALTPHIDKAKLGLVDPELAYHYEELLRLREKLKMATDQKKRQRLRS